MIKSNQIDINPERINRDISFNNENRTVLCTVLSPINNLTESIDDEFINQHANTDSPHAESFYLQRLPDTYEFGTNT